MTTASEFADAVGRKKMAETFGVGLTAVSNAVVRGRFPASWYLASCTLADEVGVGCPPELFSQKLAGSHLVETDSAIKPVRRNVQCRRVGVA